MLAAIVAAAFQDVEKAFDIRLRIGVRMIERMANAGLCGEMNDFCEVVLLEQGFCCSSISQIELLESELRIVLEERKARLLQRRIIIVVETVNADHGAAL